MAEYRRFIAYFYEYIDGRKQKSAGFAKVELRGGMWRILFRLTAGNNLGLPVKIYGFVREKGYLLGLPMGAMHTGQEAAQEWAYRADVPIKGKYLVENLAGIWIQSSDDRIFLTVWDEDEVDPGKFVLELPERAKQEEKVLGESVPGADANMEGENMPRPGEAASGISETEILEMDTLNAEVPEREASETEAAGTEAAGTAVLEVEAVKRGILGVEAVDAGRSGVEAVRRGIPGVETADAGRSGMEAVRRGIPGVEAIDAGRSGVEATKPRIPGVETADAGRSGVEAVRRGIPGVETTDAGRSGVEAVRRGIPGVEAGYAGESGMEVVEAEVSAEKMTEAEISGTETAEPEVLAEKVSEAEIPKTAEAAEPEISEAEATEAEISQAETAEPEISGAEAAEARISEAWTLGKRVPKGWRAEAGKAEVPGFVPAEPEAGGNKRFVMGTETGDAVAFEKPEVNGGKVSGAELCEAEAAERNSYRSSGCKKNDRESRGGEIEGCKMKGDIQELFRSRPQCQPFRDGEITGCVMLKPCDIVWLQQRGWQVGRSSFLQHGFYQYRHLLLGTTGDGNTIILGVPGVYNPQEKYMAGMFGFESFKESAVRRNNSIFGYWYRKLERRM